jgi:hypothetical protein
MVRKEAAMIELTEVQQQAMKAQKGPLHVVNPSTQEIYVLIRHDVYELFCNMTRPFNRGWDNPADDDIIRKDI